MEALLREWTAPLAGAREVPVLDEASLALVREAVREVGAAQGLSTELVESLVLVATELGQNQLRHAIGGRILVAPAARGRVPGLEVLAADRGLGLQGLGRVLDAPPRSRGTLGVGLASVFDLAAEIDVDVRVSEGTCLRARGFAEPLPRRRVVGVFGRPHPDEARSGDHACFHRDEDILVVAVIDGLGHGALAREASSVAVATFHANATASPARILEACNADLHRTRGAVMAVARIDETAGVVDVASVGNIGVQVVGQRAVRRFGGSSFVLGTPPGRGRNISEERAILRDGDALILFTDGVSSRLSVENELDLLRAHPAVLAERIASEHARADDDVLVLAVR